jgi:hypothetical protein
VFLLLMDEIAAEIVVVIEDEARHIRMTILFHPFPPMRGFKAPAKSCYLSSFTSVSRMPAMKGVMVERVIIFQDLKPIWQLYLLCVKVLQRRHNIQAIKKEDETVSLLFVLQCRAIDAWSVHGCVGYPGFMVNVVRFGN